jgi:hypothetical protein
MIITRSPSFTAQSRRKAKLLRVKLIVSNELKKLIEKYLPSSIKIENEEKNEIFNLEMDYTHYKVIFIFYRTINISYYVSFSRTN